VRASFVILLLSACAIPHENHCPGELTCSSMVCCPTGYPYHCGTQCYTAPPTTAQCSAGSYEVCFDDSGDGGGTPGVGYDGTYRGTCTSSDPPLASQSMAVTLVVSGGVITSGAPNGGTVDSSGLMTVTVIDRLGTSFPVSGKVATGGSFVIMGTTPNTQDATSVTCTLSKG
jgi:hypothetical protein